MTKILNEGFDHHDLVNILDPVVSVDKYAAKMGSDDEIVTITFTIKGEQAGQDLVDWLERGYDYVLDSQVSEGEVSTGKFLVFAEMNRRTKVPERIIELLEDLETLSDIKLADWTIEIGNDKISPDIAQIKSRIVLSPQDYRDAEEKEKEAGLNEMRKVAGIHPHNVFKGEKDSLLKDYLSKAGL